MSLWTFFKKTIRLLIVLQILGFRKSNSWPTSENDQSMKALPHVLFLGQCSPDTTPATRWLSAVKQPDGNLCAKQVCIFGFLFVKQSAQTRCLTKASICKKIFTNTLENHIPTLFLQSLCKLPHHFHSLSKVAFTYNRHILLNQEEERTDVYCCRHAQHVYLFFFIKSAQLK